MKPKDPIWNMYTLDGSAASVERIFSNFGLIQTKLGNCLGLDTGLQVSYVLYSVGAFVGRKTLIGNLFSVTH